MIQAKLIGALVIALAFAGIGLLAYHYKVEAKDALVARDAAIRDRDTAIAVNKENEAAMAKLQADKAASDKLAADLADEVAAANQSTLNLATSLADLRAKNADVANYLALPVPDDIRRLYDRSGSGGH